MTLIPTHTYTICIRYGYSPETISSQSSIQKQLLGMHVLDPSNEQAPQLDLYPIAGH